MIRNIHKRRNRKSKKLEDRNLEPEAENQLVFDYTTNRLSLEEISLLSKGESFSVVNHEIDEDAVKVDIYKYQRRLRDYMKRLETQKRKTRKRETTQHTADREEEK